MITVSEINYLPESPGCYIFKDINEKILYIGKAKNLKKRVVSYFNKNQEGKTAILVSHIKKIDFVITDTELEALILENNLIKKNIPKYNINLKDSKRYAYIIIHKDTLPWIEIVRLKDEKGEYYGPFVSGTIRKIIVDTLSRNFKILTNKASPILKKTIDVEKYNQRVEQARKILQGKIDELRIELEKKMKENASINNFEYAITLRDQIKALGPLKERQNMELKDLIDSNIINYKLVNGSVYLIVFNINKGILEEKQAYSFEYNQDFFAEFLIRYYDKNPVPRELIIPKKIDASIKEYLETKSKRKLNIIHPEKGSKKDLLELAYKNIDATFFAGSERVLELQKIVGLDKPPKNIECFDVSHLNGTDTVASMVSFKDGLPYKKNYRKFRIKTDCKNDDYLAMSEVIKRRYSGSLKRKLALPDLILIDGGKGQLNIAIKTLKEIKIKINVISLAKKLEEIYLKDSDYPVSVGNKNKGLQLLQAMRDEAHRFAINYQKILRNKRVLNNYDS
jgi:excinuclease ABC subunit C